MTSTEMVDTVLAELGEDPTSPVFYHRSEAVDALSEAQRFFALITLCLENTATVTIEDATCWSDLLTSIPSLLVVLRARVGGSKLRPARLEDFDALSPTWQSTPGTPARYALAGSLMASYPQPAVDTSAVLTYAEAPDNIVDGGVPEVQEEEHRALVDYAVYRCRFKEGGQEFVKDLPRFQRFLDAAKKKADYVRRRNGGGAYDRLPFELEVKRG